MPGINTPYGKGTMGKAAHRARRAIRDLITAGETFQDQKRRLGDLNSVQLAAWCRNNEIDAGISMIHLSTYLFTTVYGDKK